ncbi:hypothetical protein psyc5s11_50490 [Clostridium gelidum]|uniref:Toxin A n=1 Tax=Clostridium gelidum TaxID=704125 RepID=A0ABM7TAK0_9CLOT|nr:N-acetylmuramoyl-L-alanine amidase family protein [Clostridium gelidum]BCZ48982.1 hypothetical protein psyc5s11_50490 [Clostridium gelidum]
MIRRINKIAGLVLIATCIVSTTSVTPFNKIAKATENGQAQEINIGDQHNNVTLAGSTPTDEQIFYVIKGNMDTMYAQQNCVVLASPTPTKSIPLIISSDTATKIAEAITTDSFVKEQLIKQYGTALVNGMTQAQLDAAKPAVIKAVAAQVQSLDGQSVPIYGYKAVNKTDMTTVKDQGYFVGGQVGYMIMQKQGKPMVVSESTLNSGIVGQLVSALIDKSGIGTTISGVTDSLDDLSDSMNDLTDSLNDKNDDVDDAWDKVFDRFDNDKGWGKRDGYRYYYDSDGVSLKGVQKIKGKTYYFNRIDGAMETGWQIVDGKRCYFDKNKGYELFTQWVQDGEDKYFVGEDGTVKKMQWVNDGGKNYYLKADGKMTTDWIKIEDYWYLFNKDGSMVTSTWKWSKDKWYYLKSDGAAATQWLQLGEKWYYFKDPSGALQTGWFRADGSWYCANEDGSIKKGWAESSDGVCYLDETTGKMKKNEWVTVDGQKYYFNINGIMVTGSRYIDGTKYNFNSDGSLS